MAFLAKGHGVANSMVANLFSRFSKVSYEDQFRASGTSLRYTTFVCFAVVLWSRREWELGGAISMRP
jgi:hypothetical protein